MKEVWVNQLSPGQRVEANFVIRKFELKEYSGRKFLSLEFGDNTGRIGGVCWEGFEDYIGKFAPGNIVRVSGTVGTYREMPQINVNLLEPVTPVNIDPTDFLPRGPRDPQQMLAELDAIIAAVKDPDYRGLLDETFKDGVIRRKFAITPAAKLWHHSYIGGLAEHTLNVVKLCQAAAGLYKQVNRDLLIAGALLHDLGKIDTYSLNNFFDYTDEGRLVGHIAIADKLICNKLSRMEGFPNEKKTLIRHLVLSHQGTYDQASPVLPQVLEANILYIVDLLDSRAGGILKVMSKLRQPGQRWSGYVKLLERYLYFEEDSRED